MSNALEFKIRYCDHDLTEEIEIITRTLVSVFHQSI